MGKQWKQWLALFFWAPKSLQMLTAAMKLRCLLLWRNVKTKLDSILKSRDITLPTKVHLVKAIVSPVVMYGCESWTIKKVKVKVKGLSCVRLFVAPCPVAYKAPPSMGFSRQECWSGLPFPSPRDLPDPGIEPRSPTLQQILCHLSHYGSLLAILT